MTASNKERLEELAALVASGGASADEVSQLDALIAEDPQNAEEAKAFADAAAFLALGLDPVAPPANGLENLRAALADEPSAATSAEPTVGGPPARIKGVPDRGPGGEIISLAERRRQRATIVAVVGFAAAAAFGVLWVRDRAAVTDIKDRLAIEIKQRQGDAALLRQEFVLELADKDRAISALQARYGTLLTANLRLATVRNDAGVTAKIFIEPEKKRWLVLAFELPPAGADKDYQLWFVPTDGSPPISAGLLDVGPDCILGASPTVPPGLGTIKAAISLEPKGGSKQPTMDQIQIIGDLI